MSIEVMKENGEMICPGWWYLDASHLRPMREAGGDYSAETANFYQTVYDLLTAGF